MKEPEVETLFQLDAKIGGNSKRREILYSFIEPLNSLYLEKTEIYRAQIQACRNLSKYIRIQRRHTNHRQRDFSIANYAKSSNTIISI